MKFLSVVTITKPLAISTLFLLLNLTPGIHPSTVIAQEIIGINPQREDVVATDPEQILRKEYGDTDESAKDEAPCPLDPSKQSEECSSETTTGSAPNAGDDQPLVRIKLEDLTQQVVQLTDDNFDEVTLATSPATWLIMFKTQSCAICKKARPVFDDLSIDTAILDHNARELRMIEPTRDNNDIDDERPDGPIYIATIDAGWSGKDTSTRFEIEATPTIIVLRNDGSNSVDDDPRSYYIYYGQRAVYPLRQFILGKFLLRKKLEIPPPLEEDERKPDGWLGQMYEYLSPNIWWSGKFILKLIGAWYVFLGFLGLFLRIHNYVWGSEQGDNEEEEVIRGDSMDYKLETSAASALRQKIMWERKAQNNAKAKAKRNAAKKTTGEKKNAVMKNDVGNDVDDDDFVSMGRSVKKSEVEELKLQKSGKTNKPKDQ
mmetsp:Transcript_4212/g.9406  ORF Transcript_4212/g.9406 Transcript_4212/m.9406 type:complete len:430 (+) Transcript_4212:200-1489(+)